MNLKFVSLFARVAKKDTDDITECVLPLILSVLTVVKQEAQLTLTNRAMPVCKVVKVFQDFLSEYVDKKFTRDYNVILYLSIFNSFRVIRCLSQCVSPKKFIFTTFLFPLGRPCGNHVKCCMDGKRI